MNDIPKLKKIRGKNKKIAFLKRSMAAKSAYRRKHTRKLVWFNTLVALLLVATIIGGGTVLAAMAANLIPPPSSPPDVAAYRHAARQAVIAKAKAAHEAPPPESQPDQAGVASWYALGLPAPDALTCASTRFPRGTRLEVTDLRNGKKVVCLVNDYGPTPGTKRVIDLSRGSYTQLEGLGSGTLPAEIRVVR